MAAGLTADRFPDGMMQLKIGEPTNFSLLDFQNEF